MPKCPHCGEPVNAVQDRCFACGQSVHARGWRAKQTTNPLVFILAGVLAVVALTAAIIVTSRANKRRAYELEQQQLKAVQDSVRKANRAMVDQAREQRKVEADQGLLAQLTDVEARFNEVKSQVVKKQPSSQQQYIINQFLSEYSRLTSVAKSYTAAAPDKRNAIQSDIRDGTRKLRSLVSDLARAPK